MEISKEVIGSKYRPPSYGQELILTLIEGVDTDLGKEVCRLDQEARVELGVEVGDFVEIIGPRTLRFRVEKLEEVSDMKNSVTISRDLLKKMPFAVGVEIFVRKYTQ